MFLNPVRKWLIAFALWLGATTSGWAAWNSDKDNKKVEDLLRTLTPLTSQSGTSSINGVTGSIQSFAGFHEAEALKKALKAHLAGQATVTMESTDLSQIIMIARVKSAQCPSCPVPSPESIDGIMEHAYVISVIPMAGQEPLMLGSSAGFMLKALTTPAHYSGPILRKTKQKMTLAFDATYEFGKVKSRQMQLSRKVPPNVAAANLADDLRAVGYEPFDGKVPSAQENSLVAASAAPSIDHQGVWQRGRSVIATQFVPSRDGQHTGIGLYETTAQ